MKCPLSGEEIAELALLAKTPPLGDLVPGMGRKYRFKQLGGKVLRRLAKDLGLPQGSYEVRYNAGGSAVTGESTLRANGIYVHLGWDFGSGLYYRRASLDDPYGARSQNHHWRYEDFVRWDDFVTVVHRVMLQATSTL